MKNRKNNTINGLLQTSLYEETEYYNTLPLHDKQKKQVKLNTIWIKNGNLNKLKKKTI